MIRLRTVVGTKAAPRETARRSGRRERTAQRRARRHLKQPSDALEDPEEHEHESEARECDSDRGEVVHQRFPPPCAEPGPGTATLVSKFRASLKPSLRR